MKPGLPYPTEIHLIWHQAYTLSHSSLSNPDTCSLGIECPLKTAVGSERWLAVGIRGLSRVSLSHWPNEMTISQLDYTIIEVPPSSKSLILQEDFNMISLCL